MMQPLLETRYLPSQESTPDFWEKHYNYDYDPSGEFSLFRFNTTIYLDGGLLDSFREDLDNIKKAIEQYNLNKIRALITNLKKIEVWVNEKNYQKGGLGISVDFCAGNILHNKLRNRDKYEERWTLEVHLRFEDPERIKTHVKRDDASAIFCKIKNREDLLSVIKQRIKEFNEKLGSDSTWLKSLNKDNSKEMGYRFNDEPASVNFSGTEKTSQELNKQKSPLTLAPHSSKFNQTNAVQAVQQQKREEEEEEEEDDDEEEITDITDEEMAMILSSNRS